MSNTPADRCRVPQAFWRAIERIGLPPSVVLRQARLPSTLPLNDQGLVTTAQYFSLWKALEDLTADPGLGIRLVTGTETAVHPPSRLCAFYARDYRDGLVRAARFKRLCTPEQLHFAEEQNRYTILTEWLYATEPEPAISIDVTFASLVELGRRGTGQYLATIDEVSYLLGYQDKSSFYRAFRDWEGVTPSQWRLLNRDGSLAQTYPPTMTH